MPPFPNGPIARSRSRDVISQIEEKLKTDLPSEILEATRSSLRVSKIRNRIGCFGKYDNERKRGCALLEYEISDYNRNNNIRIDVPMERLAKAAFMKLKDFNDFHDKIGNFREKCRKDSICRTEMCNNSKQDCLKSQTASIVTSKSGIRLNMSSISSLAIQLGAFVPNSSDVALRALQLFQEVVDLLEKSSNKGGIYGLRDVQNNQSSYEAACFYLIAISGRKKHDLNSIRRYQRSSKEHASGDENQELDLMTFMDVTNVSSNFQMILDYVRELRNEIESKQCANHNVSVESSSMRRMFPSLNASQKKKSVGSRKRKEISKKKNNGNLDVQKPRLTAAEDTSNVIHIDIDNKGKRNHQNYEKQDFYSNTTFKEWKSKVIQEACEDGRNKRSARMVGELEENEKKDISFERHAALDFVTRRILLRNGLL